MNKGTSGMSRSNKGTWLLSMPAFTLPIFLSARSSSAALLRPQPARTSSKIMHTPAVAAKTLMTSPGMSPKRNPPEREATVAPGRENATMAVHPTRNTSSDAR